MTKIFRTAIAATMLAGAATAATMPVQAAAQVAGFATANPELAIAQSTARGTAYQQIGTQYQAQIDQITQLSNRLVTLEQQIDTNRDGQVDQAEATAGAAALQEAQQISQQIEQLSVPIQLAQMYVIEQVARQYAPSRDAAMQARGVQVLLDPATVQYSPAGFDITENIAAQLNALVPSVAIAPPAEWRPSQTVMQLHQAVGQIIGIAVRRQQFLQQQQQQQGQQPAVTPAPTGR